MSFTILSPFSHLATEAPSVHAPLAVALINSALQPAPIFDAHVAEAAEAAEAAAKMQENIPDASIFKSRKSIEAEESRPPVRYGQAESRAKLAQPFSQHEFPFGDQRGEDVDPRSDQEQMNTIRETYINANMKRSRHFSDTACADKFDSIIRMRTNMLKDELSMFDAPSSLSHAAACERDEIVHEEYRIQNYNAWQLMYFEPSCWSSQPNQINLVERMKCGISFLRQAPKLNSWAKEVAPTRYDANITLYHFARRDLSYDQTYSPNSLRNSTHFAIMDVFPWYGRQQRLGWRTLRFGCEKKICRDIDIATLRVIKLLDYKRIDSVFHLDRVPMLPDWQNTLFIAIDNKAGNIKTLTHELNEYLTHDRFLAHDRFKIASARYANQPDFNELRHDIIDSFELSMKTVYQNTLYILAYMERYKLTSINHILLQELFPSNIKSIKMNLSVFDEEDKLIYDIRLCNAILIRSRVSHAMWTLILRSQTIVLDDHAELYVRPDILAEMNIPNSIILSGIDEKLVSKLGISLATSVKAYVGDRFTNTLRDRHFVDVYRASLPNASREIKKRAFDYSNSMASKLFEKKTVAQIRNHARAAGDSYPDIEERVSNYAASIDASLPSLHVPSSTSSSASTSYPVSSGTSFLTHQMRDVSLGQYNVGASSALSSSRKRTRYDDSMSANKIYKRA
jgi:hypothetical protein